LALFSSVLVDWIVNVFTFEIFPQWTKGWMGALKSNAQR